MKFSLTVFALVVLCVTTSFTQETVRESYPPTGQYAVKAAVFPPTGKFATKEALAEVVSDLEDFRNETETQFSLLQTKLDRLLPPEKPVVPPKVSVQAEPPKPKTITVNGHSHKCPKCGHVWAHAAGGSHNCPVCGTYQNVVHQEHVPVQAQVQAFVKPSVAAASGCSGGNCSVSHFFGRRRR